MRPLVRTVIRAHHRAQKIAVFGYHRFDLAYCPVTILSGHGSISQLVVDCSQLLTMTFLFAEPSEHYPRLEIERGSDVTVGSNPFRMHNNMRLNGGGGYGGS